MEIINKREGVVYLHRQNRFFNQNLSQKNGRQLKNIQKCVYIYIHIFNSHI